MMNKEWLLRFRALVRKEMIATLKERTGRIILVGPLFLYILLFGYIATFNLNYVPYALCDMSHSAASEQFVRAIDNNRIFDRVETLHSPTQIAESIERGDAMLVVVIDQNFADDYYEGKAAEVQVIIDGRNSTTAQLAMGYISTIAQALNINLLGAEEVLSTRYLFNPNTIMQWFIMPGLIVMLSMLQVIILSALSVAREREQGTFEQLLVSPYSTLDLLLAKSIVPILIGLFQGTMIFLVDLYWFEIPMGGSVLSLYIIIVFFMLSIVGFGLAISAYAQTMQQAMITAFACLVPMVLLSGLFAPIQNMPQLVQWLTYLDPLRFALEAIRRIYLADASLTVVLAGMWPVIVTALITMLTAYYFFKKRL